MCGRTMPKGYELRPGGAAVAVERTYAGPGRVTQRSLNPRTEVYERMPSWTRRVRDLVAALADQYGLRAIDKVRGRAERMVGAVDRLAAKAKLGRTTNYAARVPSSFTEDATVGLADLVPRMPVPSSFTEEDEV